MESPGRRSRILWLLAAGAIGCTGPDRVTIRTGTETSPVTVIQADPIEVPFELAAQSSGNIVTTGVGLSLLAQVDSPRIGELVLQATDVRWIGDRVFAAYNVQGDVFAGAIQIIDVADPAAPAVVAEAIYPHTDISRIEIQGSTLLAAAADEFDGATFEWFSLGEDTVEVGGYRALGSYAATYVSVDGYRAYVAYGDLGGGLAVFDLSAGVDGAEPALLDVRDSFDARWVGEMADTDILLVSGSPGRLERYVGAAAGEDGDIAEAAVPGGTVGAPTWAERGGDLLYLNAAEAGLVIYDLRTMALLGALPTDGNANGLTLAADRRLAFLANGDAGLAVADVLSAAQPALLATLDVADDAGSANAVAASGEHLALADGLGGVKLLRYRRVQDAPPADCDDDGTPDTDDPDDDDDGAVDADDAAPCDPDRICGDGDVHFVGAFIGDFYNLDCDHPDVDGPITGVVTGTLPRDFDWFDDEHYVFSVERETLLIDYAENYFPVDTGLCGDPFHFAAHWHTTAIATEAGDYTVELASDDDGWLFVDGELVIDLGGVHALRRTAAQLALAAGPHVIDIYFAERHVVQSGLEFEVVGFPSPTARLDVLQHMCLDPEGDIDGDGVPNRHDVAPFEPPGAP